MNEKFNNETESRPFGARFIDGDILKIDLPSYVTQLKLEEAWKNRDRNAVTVFKSDRVTITLVIFAAGAEVKPGNFEGTGTMTLQVMSGSLLFINGLNKIPLTTGQLITVHEHIPFSANAEEETVCLLTMIK